MIPSTCETQRAEFRTAPLAHRAAWAEDDVARSDAQSVEELQEAASKEADASPNQVRATAQATIQLSHGKREDILHSTADGVNGYPRQIEHASQRYEQAILESVAGRYHFAQEAMPQTCNNPDRKLQNRGTILEDSDQHRAQNLRHPPHDGVETIENTGAYWSRHALDDSPEVPRNLRHGDHHSGHLFVHRSH